MTNLNTSTLLYPADIEEILEEFQSIFQSYDKFHEHPIHGITGLRAYEKYNEAGYVEKYDYQWKRIIPGGGIQTTHISSWGNEPHDAEWTPEEFKVETEPHHHHYDPNDRRKRRENWHVRTLRDALLFVKHYIDSKEEYTG